MFPTLWKVISCGLIVIVLVAAVEPIGRFKRQLASGDRCLTPNDVSGICRPITRCPALMDLIRMRGQEKPVVDFLRRSQCGFQGRDPTVCCADFQPAVVQPPVSPVSPVTRTPSVTRVTPSVTPVTRVPPSPQNPPVLLNQLNCGKINVSRNRIVGGEPVEAGWWPWIAALGYRSPSRSGIEYNCGGTLVTDRHVVTASHCIIGLRNLKLFSVRLGDINLNNDVPDGSEPVEIEVGSVLTHPEYTPSPVTNDIAIITLQRPVTFSPFVQPICLPMSSNLRNDLFENKLASITGWGAVAWRGGRTEILQEAQVSTVKLNRCKDDYANQHDAIIDERVMCAAGMGKDTCQGDSGGPLMMPHKRNNNAINYYLIGVVSYGRKCADPNYPGVYTRITHFIDWIERNLR